MGTFHVPAAVGVLMLMALSLGPTPSSAAPAINLLANGGFEDGTSSPMAWASDAWSASGTTFLWDNTQARTGSRSAKIVSTTPNDARWTQTVTVLPNTDYRLSGWVKTQNVAHTAESTDTGANLSLYGTWTHSNGVFGTNDWTLLSLSFNSGSNTQVTVAARLGFWSGTTTGTAWFDDLQMEVIPPPPTTIQNPSFESGAGGQPDNWLSETIQGSSSFAWDATTAHTGSHSIQVHLSGQGIARWSQVMTVSQDSEYELAGWVKAIGVQDPSGQWWTTGARLGVYGIDSYLAAATSGLRDTNDWTYFSVRFITGHTTRAKVTCTLGEADPLYARPTSSGTMWCDDIALTKIRTLPRTYLSGQHLALDVYTEDYAIFSDPVSYVAHLDEIYDSLADLVGGVPEGGQLISVKEDASMYYGLLAGNPIVIGPGRGWPDNVNTNGMDFGVPHELGHDFDSVAQPRLYMGSMDFDNAEQWANFKVLYAFDLLGASHPAMTMNLLGQTGFPLGQTGSKFVEVMGQPWIDAGRKDYQNMHHDTYTGLLYTLRQQVGWQPFKNVFRAYSLWSSIPTPISDEARVNLWANTLSRYAGVDLVPSFQTWGFPVQKDLYLHLPLVVR